MTPGSTLWLLGHELRLNWRRIAARQGKRRRLGLALTISFPFLLAVVVGLPASVLLDRMDIPVTPATAAITALAVLAVFTLMLSQTLSAAVEALYERADLDLLFSSPLEPRKVMTVRFLAVAAMVFFTFAYFLGGPVLMVAARGHPGWLGILAVLAAVALGATGTGLLLSSALMRIVGPRRMRTLAQVMGALIGASFFLVSQSHVIFGKEDARAMRGSFGRMAMEARFDAPGADWPLRAAMGEPLPLAAILVIGVGLFWIANLWLGPRFAADAAAAAGAGARGRAKRGGTGAFAAGPFAATLRKELRLLARDPALITQVLLRVLYMLPVGFLMLRQASERDGLALPGSAAALVVLAGQVAGSLAWITVSAEDAPDLLASAPSRPALMRRGKAAAAALPVAVLLAPILLPILATAPGVGLAATVGCAAAVAATVTINIWWQKPGKRAEFNRRRKAYWWVAIVELLVSMFIAGATGLAAAGYPLWAIAPAALAALLVWALRRTEAQIAEALRAAA